MRTILQSLVWKECREHVWKAVALMIVVCVLNSIVLLGNLDRETFTASYVWTIVAMVPLTVFIAANAAAGERSRNTANFLAALPVSPRRVAFVKLLSGLVSIAIPIAAAFLMTYLWCTYWRFAAYPSEMQIQKMQDYAHKMLPPPIQLGNWFVSAAVSVFATVAGIYAWAVAVGVNRRDEVSASARAALVAFALWAVFVAAAVYVFDSDRPPSAALRSVGATIMAALPCGIAVEVGPKWAGGTTTLIIGGFVQVVLAMWFVSRYGREEKNRLSLAWQNFDAEDQLRWLGRPWPSPVGAIVWKQARETGAIALVGLVGATVVTLLFTVATFYQGMQRPTSSASFGVLAAEFFAGVLAAFSIFISLVAGVGVSFTDAPRGIDAFWRSRPIHPSLWYWTKYVTGLLVLVVTLLVPVLVMALITHWAGSDDLSKAVRWEMRELGFIPANVAIYTAAMAATRMVQHAVYGAILGLGSLGIGPVVVVTGMFVYKLATGWTKSEPPFTQDQISTLMYAVMTAVSVAMLIAGSLATRNDWGWRKG